MLHPRKNTRTHQRELRRNLRRDLGTSADPPPDLNSLLNAARTLGAMLDNESGGRFGLSVHDFGTAALAPMDVPVGTAVQMVVDARREQRERAEKLRLQFGPMTTEEATR